MAFNCIGTIVYLMFGTMSANYITKMFLVRNQFDCGPIKLTGDTVDLRPDGPK